MADQEAGPRYRVIGGMPADSLESELNKCDEAGYRFVAMLGDAVFMENSRLAAIADENAKARLLAKLEQMAEAKQPDTEEKQGGGHTANPYEEGEDIAICHDQWLIWDSEMNMYRIRIEYSTLMARPRVRNALNLLFTAEALEAFRQAINETPEQP